MRYGRNRSALLRATIGLSVASWLIASCSAATTNVTAGRSNQRVPATEVSPPITPDTATPPTDSTPTTNDGTGGDSARGVGDVLFPDLGNPGIDVTHYDLDLTYNDSTHLLNAIATLSITATGDLVDFSLDSVGPKIDGVKLGTSVATFDQRGPELVIIPASTIIEGTAFDVAVTYSLKPDPSGSPAGIQNGWFPTTRGSYVINEPDGARTWLPSNDHPSDKATYRFALHVGAGETGVANGALVDHTTSATGETWIWNQPEAMATYLIQVITGPYDIVDSVGPNGLPLSSAVLTADHALMQPFVDVAGEQIDFFDNYFGPYPLSSYGIAMTDSFEGLAMEEQGRSLFSRDDFLSGRLGSTEQLLLSHELVHQWFGDAVTPSMWQDIWLNESFATYGEWMWLEHIGEMSVVDRANGELEHRHDGSTATGKPGVDAMFGYEVYDGGAVVLQALRLTIGDLAFFQTLQTWVKDNVGTSRSTTDFIALVEKVTGADLTQFFKDWLFATDLPQQFPAALR